MHSLMHIHLKLNVWCSMTVMYGPVGFELCPLWPFVCCSRMSPTFEPWMMYLADCWSHERLHFEVVSVVCLNGCLIFLFLSETLGWTDVKTSLPSGSYYHMKRLIFDHTTFLSTLLSNTLRRIYFKLRRDSKSKGSKCIDCS